MKNNYCIIMAGGVGSRFWPMSRTVKPKQFLDVLGVGRTLLQQTYDRAKRICPNKNIYIVTHVNYFNLVKEQLPSITDSQIILEPVRRNTAPCIAYASFKIAALNPNANILVASSDHLILKEDTFVKAVKSCFKKAAIEDCLITLGIKPSRPDTGYGYIQFVDSPVPEKDKRIKKVKTFTEKPDAEMAQFFLKSGDFLWNSGIFIWNVKSIIHAFETLDPEMFTLFNEGKEFYNTANEINFIKKIYPMCKNISIDYSVMEKAKNVFVRSSIIGWSDLGTWGSLYQHMSKDENENAVVGKNVMLYNSSNCVVNVPKNKLVVLEGLIDYIVVESDDILLVCKKANEQEIRKIVNDVKINKGENFI